MSYYDPDELRLEREAAAELGVTVDELRARRALEARERDLELAGRPRWVPAPAPTPDRHRHDPETIERGRQHIAAIRAQLAERKANR